MRELLLTPGPTIIPDAINQAMIAANIHHRTEEFEKLFSETLDSYARLVNSPTRPIALAGTGTAAMEAAIQNVARAGDTVIVLEAGKFGERWIEIAQANKLEVIHLHAKWGETFDLSKVEKIVSDNPQAVAICCQYCETSTTALHDVAALSKSIKAIVPESLFIVDGITAVGAKKVDQIATDIDVLISGSQKALMLPPGLAMLSMSEKAWDRIEQVKPELYYFDLLKERKAHSKNTTAFTPAISLIAGLNQALKMIESEGAENVYKRHLEMSTLTREVLSDFGYTLMAQNCPSPSVTGGYPPGDLSADKVIKAVLAEGVRLAGGQGDLKGNILRFGHMGCLGLEHVRTGLIAIATAMSKLGYKVNSNKI